MLTVLSKRRYVLKNKYRGVGFVSPQQEAWMFVNKPEIAQDMLEYYGHAPGYWEWRRENFKKKNRQLKRID